MRDAPRIPRDKWAFNPWPLAVLGVSLMLWGTVAVVVARMRIDIDQHIG